MKDYQIFIYFYQLAQQVKNFLLFDYQSFTLLKYPDNYGDLLNNQKHRIINSDADTDRYPQVALEEMKGYQSLIYFPLSLKGKPMGIVTVQSKTK